MEHWLGHQNRPRRKLALVIGISEYEEGRKLLSPVNDAKDMSHMLSRIGFIIDEPKLNLTKKNMRFALAEFLGLNTTRRYGPVLFFGTWNTIRSMY